MNFVAVQEEILKKPEYIATILENLGHENIRDRGSYYQCSNIGGDNLTGCSVRKEDLVWSNFSHGKSGSIWSMVQDEAKCNFREAITKVASWLGIKDTGYVSIKKPFGGFYENIDKESGDTIKQLPEYSIDELPSPLNLSKKFLDDRVDLLTQEEWGIRYDHLTNGIIIPWFNTEGGLIGAKWRNNDPNCLMSERWNMYLRFQMSQAIYGLNKNFENIYAHKTCIIFEAEKSVLQAKTYGCNIGIAIGGHNISETQCRIINSMMCDKIIIGFDAGLVEDEVRYNAEKFLPNNKLIAQKVGYIYDKTGELLFNKDSPTDNGKRKFMDILNNCLVWVN